MHLRDKFLRHASWLVAMLPKKSPEKLALSQQKHPDDILQTLSAVTKKLREEYSCFRDEYRDEYRVPNACMFDQQLKTGSREFFVFGKDGDKIRLRYMSQTSFMSNKYTTYAFDYTVSNKYDAFRDLKRWVETCGRIPESDKPKIIAIIRDVFMNPTPAATKLSPSLN